MSTAHLSTFGFCLNTSKTLKKPKELKLGQTLKRKIKKK